MATGMIQLAGTIEAIPPSLIQPFKNPVKRDEIVWRAQHGDAAAFEELYLLHRDLIYHDCLGMTHNVTEAEDITQTVFLRMLVKIGQFKHESKFATWLMRIAINEFLGKLRRRKPSMISMDELIEGDEGTLLRQITVEDRRLATTIDRLVLDRALAQLSPQYWAVIYLMKIEGYSEEEAARMLGISVPAIKARLTRAREQMRFLLQ